MYEFLVVWWWWWGGVGGGAAIFSGLRGKAARPSALGGRINGLKGQKGEEAGMPLGVVAGRAWCYA
jgi:hypothetical protein